MDMPALTLKKMLGALAATVLLAGGGLAASATAASAQGSAINPAAGVFKTLQNQATLLCLQPAGGST